MVPHGAADLTYQKILQGFFDNPSLPALGYDLDAEGDDDAVAADVAVAAAPREDRREICDDDSIPEDASGASHIAEDDWVAALAEEVLSPSEHEDEHEPVPAVEELPGPATPLAEPPAIDGAVAPVPSLEAEIQDTIGARALLKNGRWGVFSAVPRQVSATRPFGGWQARCVFHRLPAQSEHSKNTAPSTAPFDPFIPSNSPNQIRMDGC